MIFIKNDPSSIIIFELLVLLNV